MLPQFGGTNFGTNTTTTGFGGMNFGSPFGVAQNFGVPPPQTQAPAFNPFGGSSSTFGGSFQGAVAPSLQNMKRTTRECTEKMKITPRDS